MRLPGQIVEIGVCIVVKGVRLAWNGI